jgi:aryl-alcohol dehydrogenase-like predicted oxidoreductase
MRYKTMGRTGLKVSEVCLGTMIFGDQVEEPEAIRIIETALDAGVNFFDTADYYVGGRSEEITGKALRGRRDSAVLATKVAVRAGPGPNDAGLSRTHVMQAIEGSLRRLGTDHVGVYYAHLPDYETPIDETLRAFDDMVHQGKVRYVACSNFRAWQLCKALWVADMRNLARFDCIQTPYNLLTRDIEYELLPLCASEGIGVTVYNPLAGGLLTGKHEPSKPPARDTRFGLDSIGKMYYERYWTSTNFEAVEELKKLAAEHGQTLTHFSLAWILHNETVTSAIFGASSVSQLQDNLAASEVRLSDEEVDGCDRVWQRLRPLRFFYGR